MHPMQVTMGGKNPVHATVSAILNSKAMGLLGRESEFGSWES